MGEELIAQIDSMMDRLADIKLDAQKWEDKSNAAALKRVNVGLGQLSKDAKAARSTIKEIRSKE